jgi:hypothetical protein
MRTYDKLIATIQSGQGSGSLRSSFGMTVAAVVCCTRRPATFTQGMS